MLFGDEAGLARLLRILDPASVSALVRAEIRPQQRVAIEQLAAEHGLPVLVQPRAGSPAYDDFTGSLARIVPQVIVVDSYSMLLREDVLSIPPLGAVNVHYALLPRYRGPNPVQWALINDERETGVTLHYMSPEFDTGDVIAQRRVPVHFSDTAPDVVRRIDAEAEAMLREELPRVLDGSASRAPQNETVATTSRRRGPEDGRIDWSESVLKIYNLIRALVKPLPGAFYDLAEERVVVDRRLGVCEIASLKFGPAGGRILEQSGWRLNSVADSTGSDEQVELELDDADSNVSVTLRFEIDWTARTGAVAGHGADLPRAALEVGRRFGLEELELAELQVQGFGET